MGIADLIPGISGGTIALILGIYEEFINAIKSFDVIFVKKLFQFKIKEAFAGTKWKFLIFLLSGIILAILLLSKILLWLLENKTEYIYGFFFGLILATIPMLLKFVKEWNFSKCIGLILSAGITFKIVSLMPIQTPDSLIYIFLSGAIAISAMILPGISGSFLLVIFGKYYTILSAIHERNFIIIAVFVAGIGVGVLTFVRVVSWLLKRFHDMTMACLTGVVIGAMPKIWPWKKTIETIVTSKGKIIPVVQESFFPLEINYEVLIVLCVLTCGIVIALMLGSVEREV